MSQTPTIKRGLVDLSSVVWTCLFAGKDEEFGRLYLDVDGVITELPRNTPKKEGEIGTRVYVNSADYGYELAVNHLLKAMEDLRLQPRDLIIVLEGKNSKAERQFLLPTYKSGRDKYDMHYEQFNLCKEKLLKAFTSLGAQQVWQDGGVEADDVLGYLAINLDGTRFIISGDKDLAQVVGAHPDIHHYRQGQLDENPFGPFAHRLIPTYIALVGDSGDKIPGVKDFGKGAMENLLLTFGEPGLEQMEGLIKRKELKRLAEDIEDLQGEITAGAAQGQNVNELKKMQRALQKVIDDAQGAYLSYELGRLRLEKINTLRRPLNWKPGMVKPRSECEDPRLRKYGTLITLVSAENYAEAVAFLKKHLATSPYVGFDIESSTPPESDEWLAKQGKDEGVGVDVRGSELTGMSLTFGANMQYTLYLTHDHVPEEGVTNLTIEQMRDFMDLVPRHLITYVHNASFELPVCFMEWGEDWKSDPEYHGFLRNVRDTLIGSSYADENRSKGLKSLSKTVLDYEQQTYESVTTIDYKQGEWNGVGRMVATFTEELPDQIGNDVPVTYTRVQHKMNELTARHVLNYGADDTICTVALANHFRTIMEIEKTWDVYEEVETFPAYLTALAFVQGVDFSLEHMAAMEKEDDETYNKAWPVLRDYLMKIGYDGTRYEALTALDAAGIKRACQEVLGIPLETKVRTPSKLATLIQELEHESAPLLAALVNEDNVAEVNRMMEANFSGEPQLNLGSHVQMKALLYNFIGIPINFINDLTIAERMHKPELAAAVKRFKQRQNGKAVTVTDDDLVLLKSKAMSDDDAIAYALAFDGDYIDDEARAALGALSAMKKVMTRRSLFYKNYWNVKHWKTGKIHASANQCAAVTRRYSMSGPNLQQLPKKGEAVRFRGGFRPHHKDAVIASIDFTGQELRLAAERSQDANMVACYIGDNLKDMHSVTAAGAMRLKWGDDFVNQMFRDFGADLQVGLSVEASEYELFLRLRKLGKDHPIGKKADDLRKDSKNVNFAAQFGGRAPKLAQTLIMRIVDAQLFLDARASKFADVEVAAERAAQHAKATGFACTLMGARRHLAEAMLSDERGAADRAARQAWNMEIQGSAGEQTKLGMGRLWKSGALWKYDARFIAPVHDELVTSVHKDHAVDFLKIKHWCMTQPYSTMRIPVLGSISLGPDFADQHECGDWFIEKNIKGALWVTSNGKPLEPIAHDGESLDLYKWSKKLGIDFYELVCKVKVDGVSFDEIASSLSVSH